MNVNCWHGCGNITRDPELQAVGQSQVCKFSIAINRTWKDAQGEKKEEVTFVDCEAWGRTAELIAQYLTKGSEIYVQGRLKLDTWEKDGKKQSKLKVVAETVQFGRKASGGDGEAPSRAPARAAPAPARAAPASSAAASDDEPPF